MSFNEVIAITLRGQVQQLVDDLNKVDALLDLSHKEREARKKALFARHMRDVIKFGWGIAEYAHKLNQKEIRKERKYEARTPVGIPGH